LVTDSVLAEILAEKENQDQIVQSFVPYNLVNENFDARSVIKPIPIKAISSQQRAAFDNEAKLVTPERSVKANLQSPIKVKSSLHGVKHFKALVYAF